MSGNMTINRAKTVKGLKLYFPYLNEQHILEVFNISIKDPHQKLTIGQINAVINRYDHPNVEPNSVIRTTAYFIEYLLRKNKITFTEVFNVLGYNA